MTIATKLNIKEILGHFVEAEVNFKGYYGKSKHTLNGRIIYSNYNASLFFKPRLSSSYVTVTNW